MTAPIAFAMVSGGAGAPSVNPGDHMKQRSADAILYQERSESGNTSVPSNSAFLSSKELNE
eukprot:10946425-Ditylum_brightwellii.AAC.1